MGNPAEVAGYGNTGRNLPNNLTEQRAISSIIKSAKECNTAMDVFSRKVVQRKTKSM